MSITNDFEITKSRAEKWASEHGVSFDYLPSIGFSNDHVAMFLILSTGKFCFIEPMIVNPKSEKKVKKESVKAMLELIEKYANDLGFNKIYAMTKNDHVKKYGSDNGYNQSEFSLIVKEL